ncbi:MAG: GNAT family N-acetyltransferase [Saprospiraceae bacterium]|nr:GNAT family N-acetyltransferase [Saprospiraceae bacterium]
MLQITSYHPDFQAAFERLNRAWIEAHFDLEPEDIRVITQPQQYILDRGGAILMALQGEEVVGTVSLKKVDDTTFEMVKMTIDERFRGKGYGKILCEAIIEQARQMDAYRMILYSNTLHAGPAINMYRQMGFFEAELEKGIYARADIKMEKALLPMDKAEREQLIESYGKAYDKIVAALSEFPREMWQWRPAPNKWTIHENIIHLADSEANSYARCRKFIVEPGSTVMAYDQEAWTEQLNYHEQSIEDALELFRLLRKKSYDLIKDLPDEVWEHTVEHPENGTMTFKDWLRVYENHTHIGSMRRVYEAWQRQHSLTI